MATEAAPLLLAGPYGWEAGDGISITCRGDPRGCDYAGLPAVLASYSCWPPAVPRILACLSRSGRYDCFVQPTWIREAERRLRSDLRRLGFELAVQHRHRPRIWG